MKGAIGLLFSLTLILVQTLLSMMAPASAYAWGGIGHRMVAETAALLIQRDFPQGWGQIFSNHRFELGIYSFVPDSIFRHVDGKNGQRETTTHYFDIDIAFGSVFVGPDLQKEMMAAPVDYESAKKYFEMKIGKDRFKSMGSAPWRIEQLQQLAWQNLNELGAVKGGYQAGNSSKNGERKIFLALYELGVMAHYSGDATMPYHASSDWNGWKTGEGGIHFYFETDCVNVLEPGLSTLVFNEAISHRSQWLSEWNAEHQKTVALLYRVFADSAMSLAALTRLDKEKVILKPSIEATKTLAKRIPPKEGCVFLKPLLIERLAKASILTSFLWAQSLPDKVDLSPPEPLQFSDIMTDPAYIPPDYDSKRPTGPHQQ